MSPFSKIRTASPMVLALVLLGACAKPSPVEHVKENQDDEAVLLAVDLHRDHGWAALRSERFDEAASYFQRVLKEEPGDAETMLGLGEAMLGQGRLDDADRQFEQVADSAPGTLKAKALQGRAMVQLRRGDHGQAKASLDEAIALDPKLWRVWNGLGRVRDAEKDYVAARYAYRQAIDLNPKMALLHNNLGFSLLASGDPAYAESSFKQALALDPKMEVASANLRLALALQGRYVPALAGAGAGERARVLNNVGYGALLRGDLGKARSLFLEALEADPGFFKEARRNLAYLETLEAERAFQ